MAESIVISLHQIDGNLIDKQQEFDDKEEALEYAQELKCLVVRVYEKDTGIIHYSKPGITETTTESV